MKMSRHRRPAWAACLLTLVSMCVALPASAAERGPLRKAPAAQAIETEARVIVKFKADSNMMRALAASASTTGPQQASLMSSRLGLVLRDGHAIDAHRQVLSAIGISAQDLAARLAAEPDVEYAEVDQRMRALAAPNDPLYLSATSPASGQWYLRSSSATLVSAINAETAWAITPGSSSVVVAVLDTGVRPEHPDLAGKLLPGYDFVSAALNANEVGGRDSDPTDPGDWVEAADINVVPGCTSASDISDSSWHGTQTAGLIGAATNNNVGMASIGRNVMILPVRVLGKCGGLSSDIQDAMLWAAGLSVPGVPDNANKAKVINLSLGSTGACSQSYQDTVNRVIAAGVVVVVAAGNEGLSVGSPANCTGVVGVAGVRQAGTKVGYSDLGPQVGISAPAGNCVNTGGPCLYPLLTTSNSGLKGPVASIYTDGNNNLSLGTSFSAPLVAGTAALMFSATPTLTAAQVISALKSSARAFPPAGSVAVCTAPTSVAQDECACTTSTCGAGLLDAGAAVAAVATVTANISVVSAAVVVGDPVSLDGSSSSATGARTIAAYQWAITSGSASFTSATNASTATLVASAAGNVIVSLTVTDSVGRQATTTTTLSASAGGVTPPPASGGGGGGALNLEWLLTLVASSVALRLAARCQRRV